MKKHLKNLIILTLLTVCTLVFAPSAFALGESTTLTVTTVIDNAAAYPTEVAGLSAKYSAERIYNMTYKSSTAYAPSYSSTKTFNIVNNQSNKLSYSSHSGSNCDTYWFKANQYTDKHLSLHSVEYTTGNNLEAYTYSPTGSSSNGYATNPYNWVEVIDSAKPSSVTLHFRYNPDIGSVAPDPDPEPSYTKTIDYLGDGVANPDTTVNGVNDYRLNLDLTTQAAAEDNKADIIFVLDVSGSMGDTLTSGQTKMALMKSTMTAAIENLTTNPNNRISIIKFSSSSTVLVESSSDKAKLKAAITGLSANGYTNYYDSLADTMEQVNKMIASDTQNREKVVLFLTDGEPTFASPAAVTTTTNAYSAMVYACDAAHKISNVDKFYSVFIGDNSGSASMLQSLTQMITVSEEKYMVQATSAQQLTDTINRFMSKLSNTLLNVTVTDGLSDYVTYTNDMKVTQTAGSNAPVILTPGIDYSVDTSSGLAVHFLKNLEAANRYAVSFNVRSSDKALDEFADKKSYPNIGDTGTDYAGNATSSGKAGFYSNTAATLKYSFGTNGTAEKAYNKPVVQVVEAPAVTADITLYKVLNGMDLKAGMFNFEVSKVTPEGNVVLGTVTNADDRSIKFDQLDTMDLSKPGTYTYTVKEVIPPEDKQIKGMTYDKDPLEVIVTVTRSGDKLVTEVAYPSGQQFENTYILQPIFVTLEAKKVLEGRKLGDKEFSFNLLDSSGHAVDKQQNDDLGNIKFKPLEFTKEGVYTYTIREALPYPVDVHIEYDIEKIVTATINVKDEGGVLKYVVTYSPDEPFLNKFHYLPTKATIELKVILEGMQLYVNRFEFELKDLATGETQVVGNQADGAILFADIPYTTPGTYKYSISQLPDKTPNDYITYDKHTVEVSVIVEDEGGVLKPKPVYPDDKDFYNSYQIRGEIR